MIDLKAHLKGFTEQACHFLIRDLAATADDQVNQGPGGDARTAAHIIAECALTNGAIAAYVRGEEIKRLPPDERKAHLASFDTKEKALLYLTEQTDLLLAAIEAADPDWLCEIDEGFFGKPQTRFSIAEFPAIHMMYHDGQLNYIHTLHGDTKIHWW